MARDVCCEAPVPCDDCPKTRSAVADRREQVSGLARPQVMSDVSIKDEVSSVREIADLWKVYKPEWVVIIASDAIGPEGKAEIEVLYSSKYEDRVLPAHARVVPVSTKNPDRWPYRLELFLPNQRGEFKYRELAEAYVREQGWEGIPDVQVVPRNSKAEFRVKDYGKKKLPASVLHPELRE